MPIIPSTPKLRRFGQNGVVLEILGFFFLMKKRRKIKIKIFFFKKKKKGGGEIGVAGHPIPAAWGWPKPPQAFGGGPATPKGPKKKKKNTKKMGLGFWGWPDHPQGPGGCFGHPLQPVGGVRSHPQALGGGPATPKVPNPFFSFFFFFFPFGVAGPPPKAWGGFGHPHAAGMGWPATPWPKMGWSDHPIFWARGGSSHPDFSPPPPPFFFFLIFNFNFLSFFH
jgi:hypothetical protein